MHDIFTKDQRLVMLRTLAEDGYDANESILQDVLTAYGHNISRDLVRNHAIWLEEQGLVKIKRIDTGKGEFFCPRHHSKRVRRSTRARYRGRR
uniref:Ferric uptake regulation protein n=1 Tax=Myoviridae sp. cttp71 TaxID=2825195 RepID=A0A8S5U3T1_9CAUD|nr:MAG TPA: ferric uptake regulation protein [Myoviridae sp. cttp71]